ncbi:MAG: response regulator, partial [Betaproteobacteria bacterium]|nr:response regulator [Betaproteobacteria bacterium]
IPCNLAFRRLNIRGQSAVLGFARDMRSALAAEERLANGHANLQQILNALPVAVGIVGEGTLLYANRELEEFFALHGNEPALAHFSPMQNASFGPDQNFLQKIDNRHLQLFSPDGSMHDYMFSCFPTEFEGTTVLMGWLVDVTNLKEEEQRLIQARDQALETIEINKRFLSQLERDIREPLNGILFSLQHAVQARIESEQAQAVNAAYTFGRQMQDTLSHMLNVSGVTPPALVHEITRFRAGDFFHDALDNFFGEAEAKGITFDFRLDPALPEYLVGDSTLLRLIMSHLVDNAVKYTVVGGVTVDVTLQPPRKENETILHIIIADTGLGISDVQLGALFRSFSDGARNPKLLPENISFGLAMVRSYVSLLEGELCAVSEPEQGTEMHLVLPFALNLPEEELFFETEEEETLPFLQASLEPPSTQSRESARTKKRILVVDDIPTNMQIMVLILQKMGYEAIGADSGANALDLLEKQSFDLIFMDIQMPQMNGIEVTEHIRRNSTGRYPRDIPIVAMTAHAMLGDPEKYLAAGMNDYLSKPVIIEDIANILNNLLKN